MAHTMSKAAPDYPGILNAARRIAAERNTDMASGLIYNDDGEDITMDALSEAVESMDDEQEMSLTNLVKRDVLAALREQVTESHEHMNEPLYNNHDLLENAKAFGIVADWLDDHWSEIVEMR